MEKEKLIEEIKIAFKGVKLEETKEKIGKTYLLKISVIMNVLFLTLMLRVCDF